MNRQTVVLMLWIATFASGIAGAQEKSNDHQEIVGTWEVGAVVQDGKASKGGAIWALDKTHLIFHFHGKDPYTLYPEKDPKWIDFVIKREGEDIQREYGIYSLKGDALTICIGFKKAENRPTKFESAEGSGHHLYTMKRIARTVKEFPEPEKTFGKRDEAKYLKGAAARLDRIDVVRAVSKDTKLPVITITGFEIDFVNKLAFSPNGKVLASGNTSARVSLWDVKTGDILATLQGHARDIHGLAFSLDGNVLATSSADMTIDLWNLAKEKHIRTIFPAEGSIRDIVLAPDGKTLASTDGARIRHWDLSTGNKIGALAKCDGRAGSIAFSKDGSQLVAACEDKNIRVFDVKTGKQIDTLADHSDLVSCVTFSPDGKLLASSGRDKTIKLWDFETRKLLATLEGHAKWVGRVAFCPDGKTIASGSWDHKVKLWDIESRKCTLTLTGHDGVVAAVAFSPNGRYLASGAWDKKIKVWDLLGGD